MPDNAAPRPGDPILLFDGVDDFVEIASRPEYSLPPRHSMTISAWIRPDTVEFPHQEGSNYVHWMGKGEANKQEWVFRMYSYKTKDKPCPRPNRTSFYVFNPYPTDDNPQNRGTGSYAEERVERGEWMHIVGVADAGCTHFHKNGRFRDCDIYRPEQSGHCVSHRDPDDDGNHGCDTSPDLVTPVAGDAKLRIGTRDGRSHFLGAIAKVRIWQSILTDDEIYALYRNDTVPNTDDLVAEFLLNEGSGSQAIDGSRLANHGVIHGASWGTA